MYYIVFQSSTYTKSAIFRKIETERKKQKYLMRDIYCLCVSICVGHEQAMRASVFKGINYIKQ